MGYNPLSLLLHWFTVLWVVVMWVAGVLISVNQLRHLLRLDMESHPAFFETIRGIVDRADETLAWTATSNFVTTVATPRK